jgi:ribosomal protein S18 acetylase RimI-like enzyme
MAEAAGRDRSDDDDAVRIAAARRWVEDVSSSRLVASPLGTALIHDDFRERYDSNFLRVEGSDGTVEASEVAAECDRLFGGFAHREVIVDDPRRGAAMARGFGELGWRIDRLVTMARRDRSDGRGDPDLAEELDLDDAIAFAAEVQRESFPGTAESVVSTLARFRRVLRERADARFFGARVGDELAASCELYVHEGAAQIEDVNTLERFRGRGLARAVVLFAAREATRAGADLIWLIADDNDWPKELYAKLGFVRVGTFWQFTLAD